MRTEDWLGIGFVGSIGIMILTMALDLLGVV